MDGTLVNSSITIANSINYVRSKLGFHPMEQDYILKRVNDYTINPAKTFYHAKQFEKKHESWFSEYYTNNHDKELVLYDGIEELLHTLKAKGVKLAVATNAYRNSTLQSLTHLDVLDLFDSVACFDDVKEGKPSPDMLYKVLKELNIDIENSIFIGDGPRDKMAADHAGMDYLMVDWGFTEHKDAILEVKDLQQHIEKWL